MSGEPEPVRKSLYHWPEEGGAPRLVVPNEQVMRLVVGWRGFGRVVRDGRELWEHPLLAPTGVPLDVAWRRSEGLDS